MMELDCGAEFDPARDEEFFAALPAAPAVVRIEPRAEMANARPYLIRTADLRSRMMRLLGERDLASDPTATRRLDLRRFAGGVRYRLTGSPLEQLLVLWQHMRRADPRGYHARLRMRWPALLKVNLANAYPRCYVTRRIRADEAGLPTGGYYFGPFPSRRAADAFASEFLNLYKIRRCQIKIRRDPSFPGCIYSEMKMCLAPCFAGCTQEEYASETARVVDFLSTSGGSLHAELEREREAASEATDFERAAAVHKRLDKVSEVLRGLPELARPVEQLDAVIMQRSTEPETIAVFIVRGARIAEPFLLRFGQTAEPRSAEEILRERLSEPADADPSEPLADHLSMLARWFYSKPRAGEIFYKERDWPLRRMVRACARLLAPATSAPRREPGSSAKKGGGSTKTSGGASGKS
jgi:excinuclease UvrABC nuclease subunit